MTILDLRGADIAIRGAVGTDLEVSITFTDSGGSAVDISGYTVAADVIRGTSTVVDSFASAVSGAGSNILTLTLTDTETTTIGNESGLKWRLNMTASGSTEQWLAGEFRLFSAGHPKAGSGSSTATVQVSGSVTATASVPLPLATLDGRYVLPNTPTMATYFNGTSSNYLSSPDAAKHDITGDLELVALVAFDDWTPSTSQNIVNKWNTSQRAWTWYLNSTPRLALTWSTTGSNAITAAATAAPTITDGDWLWIKTTLDVDNGASGNDVKFYTAPYTGLLTEPGASDWTQLGSTVTTASTTSIYSSTAEMRIGTEQSGTGSPAAAFARVIVRNGIDGTKTIDWYGSVPQSPRYIDETDNLWTPTGSAWSNKLVPPQ